MKKQHITMLAASVLGAAVANGTTFGALYVRWR